MNASAFATPQRLRLLLVRLQYSPAGTWHHDPEAAELMRFATAKYAALARKYDLAPEDAAVAAFEAMRTRAVRTAIDPWAVVTRAVQITLIYEARAQGLLCSNHQARRTEISAHHDAERFCDHDQNLADYHPAFHVPAEQEQRDWDDAPAPSLVEEPTNAWVAAEQAAHIMVDNGWPEPAAHWCIEYVCGQVIRSGYRQIAYARLTRDHHAEALLDLSHSAWVGVLQALLGIDDPLLEHTRGGRGLLQLLMMGYLPAELSSLACFAAVFEATAPRHEGASHV